MIALSLALSLAATPAGDVHLANNTGAFHNLLVAQADLPPPPPGYTGYEGWTYGQLRQEYDRLDSSRPSIVGPIVMLAIGGVLAITGISIFFSALYYAGTIAFVPLLIVALVFITPGAILAIIGGIMLPGRIRERKEVGDRMDILRSRMDQMGPNAPPELGPPPPPPPGAQAQTWLPTPPLVALFEF